MCASSTSERDKPTNPNCPFCGILEGRQPGHILRQTRQTALILSLEGHAMLVPKIHLKPTEVEDSLASILGREIFRAIRRYAASGEVDGINTLFNLGAAAGQEQEHAHIHFIPRRTGDELGRFPRNWRRKPSNERRAIAEHLRRILS